jgi:transposase
MPVAEERMLDMLKGHEIQVLRRAGHTLQEVVRLAGVSQSSVQRVEAEPAVSSVDNIAERQRRGVGRPSRLEPFRALLQAELAKQPEVAGVELLRRARLAGYGGGKTVLYELIASLRPAKPAVPLVRFEGLPGEFSQHDFGQVDVQFGNGTSRRVHFFASRLKYSRWAQVSLVPDERVEQLVRALVDHFEAMGGVPLLAVFDRPKTVALSWRRDGVVTEWNPTFAAVALDLGIGIELCWPYRPQQKGAIENLVGWVKGSFFKQRRFFDEEDMQRQLAEWHEEVNQRRPSRATGVTPAARIEAERARLRALKVRPEELALRFPVVVGPTGVVIHEGRTYSMPAEAIGIAGTLYLYRDQVRIVAGRFEAAHPRQRNPGARSMLPEHRAQHLAAVSGSRAKRYLAREHLLALGPAAMDYLTELTHRRPRLWVRDIEQLHQLLQHHGAPMLRAAFEEGLRERLFGAEYIAHALGANRSSANGSSQQELAL